MKRRRIIYRWKLIYGNYFILNCRDRVVALCSRWADAAGIVAALNGTRSKP